MWYFIVSANARCDLAIDVFVARALLLRASRGHGVNRGQPGKTQFYARLKTEANTHKTRTVHCLQPCLQYILPSAVMLPDNEKSMDI